MSICKLLSLLLLLFAFLHCHPYFIHNLFNTCLCYFCMIANRLLSMKPIELHIIESVDSISRDDPDVTYI